MKILILSVITLNFVTFFPYNGSQEIHSQTNQQFLANPPLCQQTASNPSSISKTEEHSPTEDSNRYPAPSDGIAKITGSPLERNHLVMLQADLRNFPLSDDDDLHSLFTDQNSIDFAYAQGTVDNPKSNTSPSSNIIQNMPAVSSFAPNSQIRQRRIRMPLSRENGISSPVSVIYYQYKFDPSDTPHIDSDSEITQNPEHVPSTGRTKVLFASDPATYSQNYLLTALADESASVTSKEQSFLGTGTTTNEESEQEDVFFTDSTAPIEENTLIPRKRFRSLIDKDMPSKEKSVLYTEVESEAEEDAVFQETEDIPSSHNLQYYTLQDSNLENDGFPDSDTTNSHSLFTVVPSNKITVNDRDLIIPEEEHFDALYVINPTNPKKKIYFKSMATRSKINSVDESAGTIDNVEPEGSTAVPTSSNSMHQIDRMGYSRPLNIYYDVIVKPIPYAKKDPYVAWNTIRDKQLSSTMYSGNIIDLQDGYQTATDVTAEKNDRLTNERNTASNDGRNNIHVITDVVNDNFYKGEDNVKIDLASIIAAWPRTKYIIQSNDIKTLKEKPNDLGRASSDHPKVSRDEETILIDDSIAPFNPSQAKNAVKEISLTTILVPKTYLPNKTTKTALKVGTTTASYDAENIFSSTRHESEASFEKDAMLNYEADLQRVERIKSEEEDTFEDENIRDYIENSLADTQYSINPDAYYTTTFRRISKPRSGQNGFEVLENGVSKPPVGNFKSEVQRKMTATNSNPNSNSNEHFNDNIYTVMEENGQNIYIFTPETMPSFIRRGSGISTKDNTNPGKAKNGINKTNLMAVLNQFNANKMPPKATILSPDISAFESQEDNENNRNSAPSEEIRPIGLRSVLIPNQRVSRPPVSLGVSGMSPDTLVMSEVSEPTKEHLTSIDQNWEVIDEPSAVKPFPQVYPVALEDSMTFPEEVIWATNILASENGDIRDKTDSMALSANRGLQRAAYNKRGINRATELVSDHVQQSASSPSAEERAAPGTEASTSFHNDKSVEGENFYISGDLKDLNIMTATPLILKPVVASAQQNRPGSSKQPVYPGTTLSTTKLRKVQARDPLLDNLEQPTMNSYTKIYQLPMKIIYSPTEFIENSNSKPQTTENIILIPENLIKDFGVVNDRSLTDYSEREPTVWNIIDFFELINEIDHQESQAIKPLTSNSIVPSKTSANVIRNSINNDAGSSSTVERENSVAEMPHSQKSNIPLTEFGFISNDEFPIVYDSEDLSDMASFPFLSANRMHMEGGASNIEIDSSYKGESVLNEEGGYKIFLSLKHP